MDFDPDNEVNKKTLLVRLGTKERALNFIFLLLGGCYALIIYLAFSKVISFLSLISIFTLYLVLKLYRYFKDYIKNPNPKVFLRNLIISRNIVSILDIIIAIGIITM